MLKRTGRIVLCALAIEHAAAAVAPAPPAESTPAAAAPRVALLPIEARRVSELEAAFPDDAIVRLGDGPDRTIGIFRSARDTPIGVVVIVLGPEKTAGNPSDLTELRRALARHRWSTLTVALPDVPNDVLPPRSRTKFVEGTTPGAVETSAPSAPPPTRPDGAIEARAKSRLDAAVKAAREKGSKVVLLAEAAAAAWIAWAQREGVGADALVAINPEPGAPRVGDKPPKDALASSKVPVLLVMETPHAWSIDDSLGPNVTLRRLPPGQPSGERLERQIRGWLTRRFDRRS